MDHTHGTMTRVEVEILLVEFYILMCIYSTIDSNGGTRRCQLESLQQNQDKEIYTVFTNTRIGIKMVIMD